MHIKIERIFLSRLNFNIKVFDPKDLNLNLNIDVKTSFPSENQLVQYVTFDLVHGLKDSPIDLDFTFIGHFLCEGDGSPTLEEFAKNHAPAYVVPYARELVTNITSRTVIFPTIIIPPINIVGLFQECKEKVES